MRLRALASGSIVAGILAAAMALGVAAPADAAGLGSDAFGDSNLLNYRSTLTGAALYAQNSTAAKTAWGSNYVANVTKSAAAARAGAVYGNIESVPDAIPIRQMGDIPVSPKLLGNWKAPRFTGVGLNKPSGVVGATVAMTAFQYRADIANGVTSWLGIDATGAVCGSSWASSGFVNFITGQDCNAFDASQAAKDAANQDVVPGVSGGKVCDPAAPAYCITLERIATYPPNPNYGGLCFAETGPASSGTGRFALAFSDGVVDYTSSGGDGGQNLGATCPAGQLWVNGYRGASMPYARAQLVTRYGFANGARDAWAASTPVVTSDGDPDRQLLCTYTFSDGTSANGVTTSFKDGEAMPAPLCPVVPSGLTAKHIKVEEIGGGVDNVLTDQDAAPDTLTTVPDGFTANAPAGVDATYCQTNVCLLDLIDVKSNDTCFDEAATCDGWFSDPNRDADYKCTYGGRDADMQQCYMYAHVFNTSKRLAGDAYADPKTGEDVGGETGPDLDTQTMGNSPAPAINPDGSIISCLGGTYAAFNPLQWVLRPIQCAAEWAAVPRPAVIEADIQGVQHSWDQTAPGKLANAVAGWNLQPVMTGCAGYTWPNVYGSGKSLTMGNACPGQPLAALAVWSVRITDVLAVVGGGLALVRIGSRAFGQEGPDR